MTDKPSPTSAPSSEIAKGVSAEQTDCEQHREDLLDEALEESFPASDPPSIARSKGC